MNKAKSDTIMGHLLALSITSNTIAMYAEMCIQKTKIPKTILESIKKSIKIQQAELNAIEKLGKGEEQI